MADVMGELRARGIAPTAENVTAMTRLVSAAGAGPAGIKPLDGGERRQLNRMAYFEKFEDPEATVDAAPIESVEAANLPGSMDNVQDEITKQVTGNYPKKGGGGTAPAADPAMADQLPVVPENAEQEAAGSSLSFQDMLLGALGLGAGYKGGKMLMNNRRGRGAADAAGEVVDGDGMMPLLEGPAEPQRALPAPEPKGPAPKGPAMLEDKRTPDRKATDPINPDYASPSEKPYVEGQLKRVAKDNNLTTKELKDMLKDPASRRMVQKLKGIRKIL